MGRSSGGGKNPGARGRGEAPGEPPRPELTARGRLTRTRVLEAAQHLFTHAGFDETAMTDVAQRAGVAVGTLYHHFRDKHALLLELVDLMLERSAQRRNALPPDLFEGGPRDAGRRIERWLRGAYEHLRKHPTLNLVLLAQSASDPELRLRKERVDQLQIARLAALISLGQQRGVMRRDRDPAAAAFVVHHAVDAAAMQLLVREVRDPNPDAVLAELSQMLKHYLLEDERGDPLGDR
jgi:AcrR family transcriptional regulator